MEPSKKLIHTIEKFANVATWRAGLSLRGLEYNFTIIVCPKCKDSVEHKLSTINKYKYVGSSEINYEFHTKREDIQNEQLTLDISSRTELKNINDTLHSSGTFNMFDITDKDIHRQSFIGKIIGKLKVKKLYLRADYGMNLKIDIKRENDELHASVLSNESFPGDVMPLAGQGLSYAIDNDIDRIVFKNIVTPLKRSCELVQNYKISEESHDLC